MKVLHVLYSLSAEGSPRLAAGMLQQARDLGHDGAVLPLVGVPDDLRRDFESAGAQMFEPAGWTGRNYFSLFRRMRRILRRGRFDGVICYGIGPHISVGLAAKTLDTPVVLHIGNAPPDDRSTRFKIKWLLRLGRRFTLVHVACSDYVRERMISAYRIPPSAVVSVPNGIDLQRFIAIREPRGGRKRGPFYFGMVGSFEVHKDQATLVRALKALTDKGIDARLELVGRGSNEPHLRALAQRLGVAELIRWSGTLSDVRVALERFDVFAYSVTPQEGLGIALIEALAAGVPCVGSDVGACREVLLDGELGRLLTTQEPEPWSTAILEARGAEVVAPAMLTRFDISTTSDSYLRLLSGAAK